MPAAILIFFDEIFRFLGLQFFLGYIKVHMGLLYYYKKKIATVG
jgi:hypothetical protein